MCVTFKKGFKRELIPSIDKLYSHNKIMFKVQTSTSWNVFTISEMFNWSSDNELPNFHEKGF